MKYAFPAVLVLTLLFVWNAFGKPAPFYGVANQVIALMEDRFHEPRGSIAYGTNLTTRYTVTNEHIGMIVGEAFGIDGEWLSTQLRMHCQALTPVCIAQVVLQSRTN